MEASYTADYSPALCEEEEDVDDVLLNYMNNYMAPYNHLADAPLSLNDAAAQYDLDVILTLPELAIDASTTELADIGSCHDQLQQDAAAHDVVLSPWSILHNSDISDTADFPPTAIGPADASTSPPNKQDAATARMQEQVSDSNLPSFDEQESSKASKNMASPQYDRESPRSPLITCKMWGTSHTILDHRHTRGQVNTPLPCKRALTPHNVAHPCDVRIPINVDLFKSSNVTKDVADYLFFSSKGLMSTHKRRKLNISSLSKKPTSYSEEDHLLEDTSTEDNAKKCSNSSKNLDYERQRRRKINENLYALRSLVPKISKMDKASVVSDAISYVQSLQRQVEEVNKEVQALKSWENIINKNVLSTAPTLTSTMKRVQHKILEVNVIEVEKAIYQLEIICSDGQGVIANLTKAIEMLGINILNAKLTKIDDHILNTIFVEASDGLRIEPKEFKDMLLRVALMFGLGPIKC
ncbi:hypothetical protein GOP47_0017692 [Adiantum capillus-veneris]|uniref:BHLH domain-containing protein n=1 Tax=Adiantum capillus-veneris TaxID=13818 RepID=A0A9D4Z9X6_ADICA|nr:hypothetical protein GOP47_0017692 [Adiantum capillus-veneris]